MDILLKYNKGSALDIGSTIYDDDHGGLSIMMWCAYGCIDPIAAVGDAFIEMYE